ncbi:MAG: lipoate--protein ligase [Tissierellia bacterium]|nr:lipoate--protein ligase [Tissierellia bacterium]
MRYIFSPSNNCYWNLALEQYVFDNLDKDYAYFMLWQNDNTIVVGKHQNTAAEINADFVKENGINVVRRLSGGGAVYHDLGNLNFTFIDDNPDDIFDFSRFCNPVVKALASLGVKVAISGRNDMTIDGKKFSGNAMYKKKGRVMHHGTLMYDSNLDILTKALKVSKDKIESKGIKSIKSRVTNVKPYMKEDIGIDKFIDSLRDYMFRENDMVEYNLTDEDIANVDKLYEDIYSKWEWNYGASPKYTVLKERRIEGFGKLEIYMDIKGGKIKDISFYGDYFGNGDSKELTEILRDVNLEEKSLREKLDSVDINYYFNNLNLDEFINLILS